MKKGASFDLYDNIPEDMRIYLQNYGFYLYSMRDPRHKIFLKKCVIGQSL